MASSKRRANELSCRAVDFESEGDIDNAEKMHLEAMEALENEKKAKELVLTDQDEASVSVAFGSFFVRCLLGKVFEDEELSQRVYSSFETGLTLLTENQDRGEILCLFAIFMWKVGGDLDAALQMFSTAAELLPRSTAVNYNFGNFYDQALQRQKEASKYYSKVLEQDPEHLLCLNNFSAVLIEESKKKKKKKSFQKMELLTKAETLLLKAHSLAPGFPTYNLACICSMRKEFVDCKKWLEIAASNEGFPTKEQVLQDPDLENIRVYCNSSTSTSTSTNINNNNNNNADKKFLSFLEQLIEKPTFSEKDDENEKRKPDYEIKLFNGVTIELNQLSDHEDKRNTFGATTGWALWNASKVLLRFLEDHYFAKNENEMFKNLKVLDLSAGVGLLGIACAKLGAKQVVLTDCGDAQLRCILENAKLNGFNDASLVDFPTTLKNQQEQKQEPKVQVAQFRWGDDETARKLLEKFDFDLVLASDLLFIAVRDGIQDELLGTLSTLILGQKPPSVSDQQHQNSDKVNAVANELQQMDVDGSKKETTLFVAFEERVKTKEIELLNHLGAFGRFNSNSCNVSQTTNQEMMVTLEEKNLEQKIIQVEEIDSKLLKMNDLKSEEENKDGVAMGLMALMEEEPIIKLYECKKVFC